MKLSTEIMLYRCKRYFYPMYHIDRIINWYFYTFKNPYHLNMPSGQCPVQIEGNLKDGKYYYFRARGTGWSLDVCETENHWFKHEYLFRYNEHNFVWPEAGWITKSEALKYATQALDVYYKNKG